jgi:hypothetical protein
VRRKFVIPGLFVLAFAAVGLYFFVDVIPPRALTVTRMQVIKRRALRYAQEHGELPPSLTALPSMDGYDNSILDGWKKPIMYESATSGIVTFRSYGRDGKRGGEGEDADIMRSFPARNDRNKWNDELVDWSEGRSQ